MPCSNSGVLRTDYNQLNGRLYTKLLSDTIIFGNTQSSVRTQFKSSSDYLAYRKGQIISSSKNGPGPVPSTLVTNMQTFGCA